MSFITPARIRNRGDLSFKGTARWPSLVWNNLTLRLATITLLAILVLPDTGLAATETPKLRFDPSVLDRAEQYLSVARKTVESIDLKQLPSLTPDLEKRIEFCRRSIIQQHEPGRILITSLRRMRSLSAGFLLSQLVLTVDDLLKTLVADLFEAAEKAGEHQVEGSRSPVDLAHDTVKALEEGNRARTWAIDATRAQLPLGKVAGDVAAAALETARAADIALDDCPQVRK